MKNVLKNIILIIALAAVIIMIIAILLYDFIPSSSTVTEPNIYAADTKTTKVLSEIADDSGSLGTSDKNSSDTSSGIVLQSYSITETDLALYAASNSYEKGKADPFADVTTSDDSNSGNSSTSGSTTNSNSGNKVESKDDKNTTTSNNSTNNNTSNSNSTNKNSNSSNTTNSSNTVSKSQNTVSDGTLFNSTHSK